MAASAAEIMSADVVRASYRFMLPLSLAVGPPLLAMFEQLFALPWIRLCSGLLGIMTLVVGFLVWLFFSHEFAI